MNKNKESILDLIDKRTLKNFGPHCWWKVSHMNGDKIRFSKVEKSAYLAWVPIDEPFYRRIKRALKLKK